MKINQIYVNDLLVEDNRDIVNVACANQGDSLNIKAVIENDSDFTGYRKIRCLGTEYGIYFNEYQTKEISFNKTMPDSNLLFNVQVYDNGSPATLLTESHNHTILCDVNPFAEVTLEKISIGEKIIEIDGLKTTIEILREPNENIDFNLNFINNGGATAFITYKLIDNDNSDLIYEGDLTLDAVTQQNVELTYPMPDKQFNYKFEVYESGILIYTSKNHQINIGKEESKVANTILILVSAFASTISALALINKLRKKNKKKK